MYKPFTLLSVLFLNPPWPKKNIHIFKSVNIKNNGFTFSVLPVTSSIKLKSDPVHCFVLYMLQNLPRKVQSEMWEVVRLTMQGSVTDLIYLDFNKLIPNILFDSEKHWTTYLFR